MRHLILVTSLIGFVLYAGYALQADGATVYQDSSGFAALEHAIVATGASVRTVRITGWAEVSRHEQQEMIQAVLARQGALTAPQWRLVQRGPVTVLSLTWTLEREDLRSWERYLLATRQALGLTGGESALAVQLEGETKSREPLSRLVAQALDAAGAQDRQPWSDLRAASSAGRSLILPPGPLPVNIQVAARQQLESGTVRVWIAWPVLSQEY